MVQPCVRLSWLNITGGSIGQGGPVAVDAAIACPERTTLALLGDGGAMYTNQFLWTAARENLNVIAVIFANRQYNILEVEYRRLGINDIGERAASIAVPSSLLRDRAPADSSLRQAVADA